MFFLNGNIKIKPQNDSRARQQLLEPEGTEHQGGRSARLTPQGVWEGPRTLHSTGKQAFLSLLFYAGVSGQVCFWIVRH